MRKMPEHQKQELQNMSQSEILDFQMRLQIECGMDHQEAADYIAQAFNDDLDA